MIGDKEIIQAILEGDKKIFSILYKQYSDRIYSTALSFAKNIADAEEITQDVFVKIYKNAVNFKGDSKLSTWIYRITINTALNFIKKRNSFSTNQEELRSNTNIDFVHPGVLMENKEEAIILYKVMDKLPSNQKTAFILSFVDGLPRQEVADIMLVSLKAVESLLQRAKRNMRLQLEKLYPNRRKSKNKLSK